MINVHMLPSSRIFVSSQVMSIRTHITPASSSKILSHSAKARLNSFTNNNDQNELSCIPTMLEIMNSSKSQNVNIQLQTLGPFFRITATSLETNNELGKAEGIIRLWWGGKILHLDSVRLQRETLSMEKSIFGIGLFVGAVAIRYGYDCGCEIAELLAINDSDLYHSKLVRFYTRIGFKAVHEVTGSSIRDMVDMLVWGGYGTRMDADVTQLLIKWGRRSQESFKLQPSVAERAGSLA